MPKKDKPFLTEYNQRIAQKQKVLKEIGEDIDGSRQELLEYEASVEKQIANTLIAAESVKLIYSYPDNVPDYVKNLPAEAQKMCISAFNATIERGGDEDQARIACWGAVKTKFEQDDEENWVPKASEILTDELKTVAKTQAMHNRLHAEYLDARHTARKKAQISADHTSVVQHLISLGGRHIPKGDTLDKTLPDELKESPKLRYLGDSIILSDEKPSRSEIQVLRTGTFHHPQYGKFTITSETLTTMVQNFEDVRPKAPTEMVVDWEHMSVAEPPVKAPAAGWVKSLRATDDELFVIVEWTEEAAGEIEKKEYRFISPEFDFNYKDKESGKRIGPTLLSVALTNRPFIEGMEPVVLSEVLGAMIFSEEVNTAELKEEPIGTSEDSEICLAEWDTAYINDLPDSAFAYIKPGGEKEEGKTVPRSLRYLPYKNAQGEIDLPHLRNALSRLAQTALGAEEKAKARRVLVAAARKEGVGDYSELPDVTEEQWKEVDMEKQLRELLGLSEDADIVQTIKDLKEKAESNETQLTELQGKLTAAESHATEAETKLGESEVEKNLDAALNTGKITPKMREWAKSYALRDPEGFKSYLETAEKIGPELGVRGREGSGTDSITLTETEKIVAGRLGVSEEDLAKSKREEEDKGR